MSNGNVVIKQIKEVIERGGNLDANTRDVLLLSAIVDIYDQLEKLTNDTRPAVQFSKSANYFLTFILVAIIGFIGSLLTGKVEVIFK